MEIERIPGPKGASFSTATITSGQGRWIHVSGQVALGPNNRVIDRNAGEQARVCFNLIEGILAKANARLSDVVRITAYLTSLDDYSAYAEAREEKFGEFLPASTAVQVAGLLLGAKIEIDAVAFAAEGR